MNIYLIGLDHKEQKIVSNNRPNFDSYLNKIIQIYNIDLLAEEYNDEPSILENISVIKNISYLNIEPNERMRRYLGIPTSHQIYNEISDEYGGQYIEPKEAELLYNQKEKKYFDIRENYWLRLLKKRKNFKNCLLLCGAYHIDTISKLLSINNMNVNILEKNYTAKYNTEYKHLYNTDSN